MQREAVVYCCACRQPIVPGEGFTYFKVPGKESYRFFHCRSHAKDCWEGYLKEPTRS
jgi:predicted RNA-binding Zn-ribbon protein involved in translation (DUF1610 family)